MKSALGPFALVTLEALTCVGCSSPDSNEKVALNLGISWKADPGSVEEIGYSVGVDIAWPDRVDDCFALPADLRVSVNDRPAKPVAAEGCRFDVLTDFDGFVADEPIEVRLSRGEQPIASASLARPFLGFDLQLVAPPEPILHVGERFTLSLPFQNDQQPIYIINFYWRDPTEGVPPFHSSVLPTVVPSSTLLEGQAPALTGRAWMVVDVSWYPNAFEELDDCVGFEPCFASYLGNPIYGPIAVDVVP